MALTPSCKLSLLILCTLFLPNNGFNSDNYVHQTIINETSSSQHVADSFARIDSQTTTALIEPHQALVYENVFPLIFEINLPLLPPLSSGLPAESLHQSSDVICEMWKVHSRTARTSRNSSENVPLIQDSDSNLNLTANSFLGDDPLYSPSQAPFHWLKTACKAARLTDRMISYIDEAIGITGIGNPLNTPLNNDVFIDKQKDVLFSFINTILDLCCNGKNYHSGRQSEHAFKDLNRILKTMNKSQLEDRIHRQINATKINNTDPGFTELINKIAKNMILISSLVTERNGITELSLSNLARTTFSLAYTIQRTVYAQNLENSKIRCNQSLFPYALIPVETLLDGIWQLEPIIESFQWVSIVSKDKWFFLTDHPRTSCQFSAQQVKVKINIPVRHRDTNGQIYLIRPLPFRLLDSICSLNLPRMLLWQSEDQIAQLEHDSMCKEGVCRFKHIADFEVNNTPCMEALLGKSPVKTIIQHCPYTCLPGKFPVITRWRSDHMTLVSDQTLILYIPPANRSYFIESNPLGYVSITMACPSTLKDLKGKILIHSLFPCDDLALMLTLTYQMPVFTLNSPGILGHVQLSRLPDSYKNQHILNNPSNRTTPFYRTPFSLGFGLIKKRNVFSNLTHLPHYFIHAALFITIFVISGALIIYIQRFKNNPNSAHNKIKSRASTELTPSTPYYPLTPASPIVKVRKNFLTRATRDRLCRSRSENPLFRGISYNTGSDSPDDFGNVPNFMSPVITTCPLVPGSVLHSPILSNSALILSRWKRPTPPLPIMKPPSNENITKGPLPTFMNDPLLPFHKELAKYEVPNEIRSPPIQRGIHPPEVNLQERCGNTICCSTSNELLRNATTPLITKECLAKVEILENSVNIQPLLDDPQPDSLPTVVPSPIDNSLDITP
jgi:hypothetical protein